jgi:hypothetical protein
MLRRDAALLSVYTGQELDGFWEKLVQMHVFTMIFARFGGTETVNRSRRKEDKLANGQCMFIRKSDYVALGGHESVRNAATEDIALAQRFFVHGRNVILMDGHSQFTTRMYTSLKEIIGGWRRSFNAGLRMSMPFGAIGQMLYPVVLILPPVLELAPAAVLAASPFVAVPAPAVLWASLAETGLILLWLDVYRGLTRGFIHALLHPLAALIVLYISATALLWGRSVHWKGRKYVSD